MGVDGLVIVREIKGWNGIDGKAKLVECGIGGIVGITEVEPFNGVSSKGILGEVDQEAASRHQRPFEESTKEPLRLANPVDGELLGRGGHRRDVLWLRTC